MKNSFDATDRLGGKQHVPTHVAHLGRHMIDYDDFTGMPDRVSYRFQFIMTWTSLN